MMPFPPMPELRRAAHCAIRSINAGLSELCFRVPLYKLTLARRGPREIRHAAPDPWPGFPARGEAIVEGRFALGGETVFGDLAAWGGDAGPAWREAFHSFEWLRDLRALGGDPAHQRARKLVKDWITRCDGWSTPAWRGDVLGRRLASWVSHYDFFAAGADAAFRAQVLVSLARQTRHLSRILPGALDGAALLSAIKGLVLASLALPNSTRALARALDLLARELPRQILPDGGHVERCPSLQLSVLRDLVDLRGALLAAQYPVPEELLNAIDRVAPMLRFFRLGDGGLALFNSGGEEEPWLIDLVLTRADAKGKPLSAAPHSRFQRLALGRSVVVLDAGAPVSVHCARGIAERAHAGTLAFEMSEAKDRLIVNCGPAPARTPEWNRAARATAAHSTLVVADTNSAEIREDRLANGPESVLCRRTETEEGITLEAQHDGYAGPFGLVHRRRLTLSAGGEELRGEDSLIAAGKRRKRSEHPFAIRFHLHPDVKALPLQDAHSVLLKLASGMGVRFAATGGSVAIEDSVYLGTGEPRKSRQIVVTGTAKPAKEGEAAVVSWVLARAGAKPGR